jgi:hypothetical protein
VKILIALVGGVFLGWMVLFAVFMFGSGVKVLWSNENSGYTASLLERRVSLFGVKHQLAVGRGSFDSRGYYGHFREIGPLDEPAKLEAQWDDSGLTILEASGHRTFIPSASYKGGR